MSLYSIPGSTPVLAPVAIAGWRNHAGHVLVYAEPLSRLGLYASLAIIYAWFGGMKFTEYEAQGLVPLVENSPLLSWFYALFSVRGFSTFLGFVELSIGLLIALRLASPIFSAAGGLLSAGLFVTTLSFMVSTPGVVVPELGAPAITVAPGQFLLKDVGLFAASFWVFRRLVEDCGSPTRKVFIMSIRKRLTATVLAIAIAAPIADFFWSKSMPQATTSLFQWASARATAGQSRLTSLKGANEWLNSQPLTPEALRGKVVLIDFWTYTCINWLRTAPYVRAWEQKYRDQGLVVIGVHSPEFAFEKDIENVRRAVRELGITYPVAVDSGHAIWRGFENNYWPALYFIDAQGRVRHHHFGEGSYDESESFIQKLLAEAGAANIDRNVVAVDPRGFEVAADWATLKSPENYLGYVRTENFASPGGATRDQPKAYEQPERLRPNEWALAGDWTVRDDASVLNASGGVLATRFHARDVNLVMSPPTMATAVRFRVTIDGKPPGDAHGLDVDEQGYGTVTEQRLYQLIRQPGAVGERTVEVEFLNPGVETFAFTFG